MHLLSGGILHLMYQKLVAGLFIGGLAIFAYYIRTSNIEELISYASYGEPQFDEVTVESVTGRYLCTDKTGCKGGYQITLYQNKAVKLVYLDSIANDYSQVSTSSDSLAGDDLSHGEGGIEASVQKGAVERGTWELLPGGFVEAIIVSRDGEPLESARSIVVQYISPVFLTKFIYDAREYPHFYKPRFVREELIKSVLP